MKYEELAIEVLTFAEEDVITASGDEEEPAPADLK